MFHATRSLLAFEKFDSKRHSGIIAYFNRNYIKTNKIEKKYSRMLMDAQDFRNDSDYDDFFTISKEEAKNQYNNAELFYKRVHEYLLDISS